MKVLFIGGTGVISAACVRRALDVGHEVTVLNRGRRGASPDEAGHLTADYRDAQAFAAALEGRSFDVVANFIAFTPEDIQRDLAVLSERVGHYLFISSASVYQKPPTHHLITESTPLSNRFWDYSRNKIACEETLMRAHREAGFPGTIVRPSLTYDRTLIPLAVNAWGKPFTVIDRMRRGKPILVHGDGTSLWTVTHSRDFARGFVGLMGHRQSWGHAFHITSDEVLSWDQIYEAAGAAAGAKPNIVHVTSDDLVRFFPEMEGSLLGDKTHSAVFDNSKIKSYVPDFVATTRFSDGIAESIRWYEADPGRSEVDREADAKFDALVTWRDECFRQAPFAAKRLL